MLLSVQDYGASSPGHPDVVFIHGTGADASLWKPQVDLLVEQGYRCILPELRGHGQTIEPGHPTALDVHIGDIMETLQHLQIRLPAIFVGHSLGAIISVELSKRRPDYILQILAISLPGKVLPPVRGLMTLFLKWPYRAIKDTVIHRNLSRRHQILISTNHHSLREIVHNFGNVDYVSQPIEVSCPVHFSVGALDIVAPAIHVKKMHQQLPNSTLRIFGLAGHSCMDDQPEEFNRWFLDRILTSSQP